MVSPQPFLAVILFYICCFYQAAELLRPNGRSLTDLCPYCVAKLVSKDFFAHWNSWKTASSLFLSCFPVSRLWKSVYHTYSAEFQLVNTLSCSLCSPVLCCKLTVYFTVFFFSCCQTIECACNSDKSYQFPWQTVTPALPYWDTDHRFIVKKLSDKICMCVSNLSSSRSSVFPFHTKTKTSISRS